MEEIIMNIEINLTQIIVAVIALLGALITRYVIPFVIGKIDADKRSNVIFWAKLAVEAAEKIFKESGMGAEKKQYVKEFLESKGFKLDETEIDVAIESAVLEMQNAIEHGLSD